MTQEFLSPRDDFIFKLLFGDERSIEILTDFLKSVLRLPADDYEEVTLIDPHLKKEHIKDKLGILDVRVRTKSRKVIDIEIQVKPSPELRDRVVYYGSKMIAEQMASGGKYTEIKRVIQIIITDHLLISGSGKYHHRFTLYNPETQVEFSDILEVNTLELPKLPSQDDGTQLWNWMRFLAARGKEDFEMIAEKNPQVKQAVLRLEELSNDEETRLIYESRQKMEWDNAARDRAARKETSIAIAKNMLSDGEPIEKILRYTGLNMDELAGLRETN